MCTKKTDKVKIYRADQSIIYICNKKKIISTTFREEKEMKKKGEKSVKKC